MGRSAALLVDIVIRVASLDDAAALSKYMNALADENLEQLSGLRPSPEQERDFLQKASENGRAFVLVAWDRADIIGVLDLWPGEMPFNRHAGRLGMSVLAPYRRRGIGRRLLEHAIERTKQLPDFCRIVLDVAPANEPAISLYESVGFVREGSMKKAAIFRADPGSY